MYALWYDWHAMMGVYGVRLGVLCLTQHFITVDIDRICVYAWKLEGL